jgi:hypothetical protein
MEGWGGESAKLHNRESRASSVDLRHRGTRTPDGQCFKNSGGGVGSLSGVDGTILRSELPPLEIWRERRSGRPLSIER